MISLAFDGWVDEWGGVKAFDEREGCVLTCVVGGAELFILAGVDVEGDVDVDGEGVIELTVTVVSGTGVPLACPW